YQRMTEMTIEQKNIRHNTGISVTNAALLLLWWPSIAFNEIDANEAMHLIEQKKIRLLNIYEDKQCNKKRERREKRERIDNALYQ
ncbi:MAG: hypothetical protein OEZ01_17335, partial [Candidatus Heimdallarchaeota archaeon]|nr:hypothetical protein [Candidatus Heimdallarchaeota archaeon]